MTYSGFTNHQGSCEEKKKKKKIVAGTVEINCAVYFE
jgi:hypothetical protein